MHSDIARTLEISAKQVAAVAALFNEGATVPFIARYRKEATGSLDEQQITSVRDELGRRAELDKRRHAMLDSLTERELLTGELEQALKGAADMTTLEDIYLPYRPKRRTRGMIAREKGLEPLAREIMAQTGKEIGADKYIDPHKDVANVEDALAGARDIIAEWVSEDAPARSALRRLFAGQAQVRSKLVKKNEEQAAKFRDYFDWQEPASRIPSHRLLAIFRGENEKALTVAIRPAEEDAVRQLQKRFVKNNSFAGRQTALAVEDGYKRLLAPSLENELRNGLKEKADLEAIGVFAANLRELLMVPPLGRKRVMALDPGFRTGAKLVCLDEQGKLLHNTTIYPAQSEAKVREAAQRVKELVRNHDIEAIAIGNGTAGRETESFVRELGLPPEIVITLVNESGASIYSASDIARREFPDHDITVRGAVSIGRRLQDPLAELVKIDPKSIGVGQYQHDVDQRLLKKSLDDVVMSCVNSVGVEVNTASAQLLTYVSGLGPVLAGNIVARRDENGVFASRRDLQKVPRLGAKAFEQCAGFLRVGSSANPLDTTGVHPERYGLVEKMARDAGTDIRELLHSESARKAIDINEYVSDKVGLPTLRDIMAELAKPGRDPREDFTVFRFAEGINAITDLREGMQLPGIVTNVTKFGAFVDVGVHQDGLVHISELADRFVKDPAEIVKVGRQVSVKVLSVDADRKRISLSMRK